MMIKNLLALSAIYSIVDGSYADSLSCSNSSEPSLCSYPEKMVSEPHRYFLAQLRRIVDSADAISPDAIELPDNHLYPVIDISSWLNPSASSEEDRQYVVNRVLEEASANGSFNIIGHGIKDTLFDRLYSSAKNFFSMSLEQKMQYSAGNNLAGYIANRNESVASFTESGSPKEQKDLRESFIFAALSNFDGNSLAPQDLLDSVAEYMENLHSVEIALKQIFTAALNSAKGIDLPINYLKDVEKDAAALFRASRYPEMPDFEDATKLLPHSDVGTFTIIHSVEEGLEEVRDGRWYKVPMSKGELHVNIAEVYTMWSNGLFKNNIHRVSNKAEKDRISVSYFASQGKSSSDDGISPVCSEGEVVKFPRVSPIRHLKHYVDAFTGKDGLYN
jgi:isopenicillin N synthase-like dioxygenase